MAILNSMNGSPADADSLYGVWAGANELFNLPSNPAAIPGFLAQSVQNIAIAITKLANQGAKPFWCPPTQSRANALHPSRWHQRPVHSSSNFFNAGLANTLDALENDLLLDNAVLGCTVSSELTGFLW